VSGPVPIPVLVALLAAAFAALAFASLNVLRHYRLRRHLRRLRTMPLDPYGR
jgi:uncharacterized integral membrane protein